MTTTIPRETKEFFALAVLANGQSTTSFEVAVHKWPVRPSAWQPADVVDGEPGVILENLTTGTWVVWVRVTTAAEAIVVKAGTVQVQ